MGRIERLKPIIKNPYVQIAIPSIMLVFLALHNGKKEEPAIINNKVEQKLSQIQQHIDKLPGQTNTINLQPLSQELQKLSDLTEKQHKETIATQKQNIEQVKLEFADKINALQQQVTELKPQKPSFKYQSPNYLPFKVLSIDSLQQLSVATALYSHKTTPLEAGDSLADWTVKSVSFARQEIVFENLKHERVRVKLGEEQNA